MMHRTWIRGSSKVLLRIVRRSWELGFTTLRSEDTHLYRLDFAKNTKPIRSKMQLLVYSSEMSDMCRKYQCRNQLVRGVKRAVGPRCIC